MAMTELPEILSKSESKLASIGISWMRLKEKASQIVLFGSQASGDASPESDWDFLIVSDAPDRELKRRGIDLIWITTGQLRTENWLGSELANHIAKYGIWLHGIDSWSRDVFVSDRSVEAKKAKIRNACEQLLRVHDQLDTLFLDRRIKSLRRDLQRLMIMIQHRSVPPTPVLDREWAEMTNRVAYLSDALEAAAFERKSPVAHIVNQRLGRSQHAGR